MRSTAKIRKKIRKIIFKKKNKIEKNIYIESIF